VGDGAIAKQKAPLPTRSLQGQSPDEILNAIAPLGNEHFSPTEFILHVTD
jgi:hypothetical protein